MSEVKFVTTTQSRLSQLTITNGQLIYVTDINATFVDMNNTRNLITGMSLVSSLPTASNAQAGIIYCVVNAAGKVDAYVFDSTASTFRQLTGYAATVSSLGLVQPDGSTITVDSNGVISVSSMPAASVAFDGSASGLASTEVQSAIIEVNGTAEQASASASSAISDVAAASTAIADHSSRLAALEAIAAVALIP